MSNYIQWLDLFITINIKLFNRKNGVKRQILEKIFGDVTQEYHSTGFRTLSVRDQSKASSSWSKPAYHQSLS